MEIEKKTEKESSFTRWDWFAIFEILSQGDITKFEAVGKMNFILCLNLLSYWKEKQEKDEQVLKQIRQNRT